MAKFAPLVALTISAVATLAFVGQVFGWFEVSVDSSALYTLGIALAALVVPTLTELTVGKDGVSLKIRVDEIDKKQDGIQKAQSDIKAQIDKTTSDLSSHQLEIVKLAGETKEARSQFDKSKLLIDRSMSDASATIAEFRARMEDARAEFDRIEKTLKDTKEVASALERSHLRTLVKESPKKHGKRGTASHPTAAPTVDSDDPNKNQFGGSPSSNGRTMSATVKRTSDPDWFRIRLKVESTDPQRPLADPVEISLHPTFTTKKYMLQPKDGVATDEIYSYGAFTVGAVADKGETRLELDLAEIGDAPKDFRER